MNNNTCLRIDTHVHTSEVSRCSHVSADEMVDLYTGVGYQGVVVTNHFSEWTFEGMKGGWRGQSWRKKVDHFLAGYQKALEKAKTTGLLVFLGAEFNFPGSNNDYLVYGISRQFLYENEDLLNLGFKAFSALARRNGMLIFQAHPFRCGMTPEDPSLVDGIEIFNGNKRHASNNNLAYEYACRRNLKMLSGSDFHEIEDLGAGGICVEAALFPYNGDSLVSLLRNGVYTNLTDADR